MKKKKQTQIIINNLKDIIHFIHETCTWEYRNTEYKSRSKILKDDNRNEELNIQSERQS